MPTSSSLLSIRTLSASGFHWKLCVSVCVSVCLCVWCAYRQLKPFTGSFEGEGQDSIPWSSWKPCVGKWFLWPVYRTGCKICLFLLPRNCKVASVARTFTKRRQSSRTNCFPSCHCFERRANFNFLFGNWFNSSSECLFANSSPGKRGNNSFFTAKSVYFSFLVGLHTIEFHNCFLPSLICCSLFREEFTK